MTGRRSNGANLATTSTLVVTNLMKLAGVVLGVHEGLESNPDGRVLGLAALFAAGVQVTETVLLGFIDRLLAQPPPEDSSR